MYLLRLLFFVSADILLIVLFSRPHFRRGNLIKFLSFSLVVVITAVSLFFPFEDFFYTFSSPEEVCNYKNAGNVKLVVPGTSSDFVVSEKTDSKNYTIVPKTEKGWKIGSITDLKQFKQKIVGDVIIYIYRYGRSNDFFITVFNSYDGEIDVSDNRNFDFTYLETHQNTFNETYFTYYAHIENYDTGYELYINGVSASI